MSIYYHETEAQRIGAAEVRRLRILTGRTVASAAQNLGVAESTWRRWEHGLAVPLIRHQHEIARQLEAIGKGT